MGKIVLYFDAYKNYSRGLVSSKNLSTTSASYKFSLQVAFISS